MATVTIDSLDLAALVCSKVCHDVISPVGAIVNGLEVLEEDNDPTMRDFALDLIRKSARAASARLQFARLAFGAAGSAGAAIDLGDAEAVAKGMYQDEKVAVSWSGPRLLLPKNQVKLLLNLLVLAAAAIPRGGSVAVEIEGGEEDATFTLTSRGINARIPPHAEAMIAGEPEGAVDAHAIQPYYTGMVARAAGMQVGFRLADDAVTITAARDGNPAVTPARLVSPAPPRREDAMKQCLIVDDSAIIRKVARRIVEGLSLRTDEAEDGEQALAACRAGMPDAILLDWSMPVMDGCEFLRALRRMPGGDVPKVVFCTTEYDVAHIARAMHAGADDYVMKPFDRDTMVAKLQDVGVI